MITNLFLNIIALSLSASLIIIFLLAFAPFLNKRYAMKWKYLIWVGIAVRLIIPFNLDIPFPRIVFDVPTEITVPIDTDHANDSQAILPAEQKLVQAYNENAAEAPAQREQKPIRITLLDIVAYVWLAGCLMFLSVHIFSFLHYKRRIAKKGIIVKERHVLQQAYRLTRQLRIKSDVRIMRYRDAESPMVIGFLRPTLVLPNCGYNEEELYFVLKHELIHIKRHDIYIKLLFVIANALHWFNPLVYVMQKEAVVDMELSCDEEVIKKTAFAVRKAYTETLLSTFNKQRGKGAFLTTQFYGGKEVMKKRFRNILTRSPKRNGLLLCICTICITLISGMMIGCSAMKNESPEETVQTVPASQSPENDAPAQTDAADDSSTDITSAASDMQSGSAGNPMEPPAGPEESTYKSILLGRSDFTCTDLGNERINISGIGRAVTDDDSITVSATRFASADVDGDGEDEVVLWLQINNVSDYGFEILHDINGEIYGYTLQYRAFMNPKEDGTFLFSGGAADSGIGKLSFSETGYSVNAQAYSQSGYDSNNELTVQYFINDEPCSEDEFNGALSEQDQKPDAEWADMTENNINALLR